MKIDYKILWFEDRPNDIRSGLESVNSSIQARGFRPNIEIVESVTPEEVNSLSDRLSRYNTYDLIVFDYDLGEGPNGAEVAASLRRRVWTDMVFYSGKTVAELRRILFENGVDAVFPVHRPNLAEELEMIIEDHVRKICDLNNMRGILIDEICDIERSMRRVASGLVSQLSEDDQDKILEKIRAKVKESGERLITIGENIESAPGALSNFLETDFNVVRTRLWSLQKGSGEHLYLKDGGDLQSLQKLRNRFAHVSAQLDAEAGHMTLDDDPAEVFDYPRFEEIRRLLVDISERLNEGGEDI